MDDYISKPIKPEVLAARLSPWLHPGENENSNETKQAAPLGLEEQDVSLTWNRDRSLSGDGGER